MKTELFLVNRAGDERRAEESEIALIFGRITQNAGKIIKKSVLKPKAAYFCLRALASHSGKDPASASGWKHRMLKELLGFEYEKIRIRLENGQDMFFSPEDVQVENVVLKNQYSLSDENIKERIVVDAGANTGVFSILAAKMGAKKVYAFEPIPENVEMIRKNAEENGLAGVVVPVQMAVGDKEAETWIEYSGAGDPSASLALEHPYHKEKMRKCKVRITTIDKFAEENNLKIGFIKMDIEGFEREALDGARKTIKENKPFLSLSAYHKPDDKEVLPKIIKEIRSDYKGVLLNRSEEVFYFE